MSTFAQHRQSTPFPLAPSSSSSSSSSTTTTKKRINIPTKTPLPTSNSMNHHPPQKTATATSHSSIPSATKKKMMKKYTEGKSTGTGTSAWNSPRARSLSTYNVPLNTSLLSPEAFPQPRSRAHELLNAAPNKNGEDGDTASNDSRYSDIDDPSEVEQPVVSHPRLSLPSASSSAIITSVNNEIKSAEYNRSLLAKWTVILTEHLSKLPITDDDRSEIAFILSTKQSASDISSDVFKFESILKSLLNNSEINNEFTNRNVKNDRQCVNSNKLLVRERKVQISTAIRHTNQRYTPTRTTSSSRSSSSSSSSSSRTTPAVLTHQKSGPLEITQKKHHVILSTTVKFNHTHPILQIYESSLKNAALISTTDLTGCKCSICPSSTDTNSNSNSSGGSESKRNCTFEIKSDKGGGDGEREIKGVFKCADLGTLWSWVKAFNDVLG